MGNDGGSIPHRAEVVKNKKKEERKDNFEMARAKSRLCAISKTNLREPIAVCRIGLLYNKEELIKRLLEKQIPRAFRHIKKLRDVKEVKVQTREDPKEPNAIVIVCPVSQIEFNGFNRFAMNWACGCVFSEEAMKELKSQDKCVNCSTPIEDGDLISLNQTPEQQLDYLAEFDEQERKAQEEKDAKKKHKKHSHNGKRHHKDRDGHDHELGSDEEVKRSKDQDDDNDDLPDGQLPNKRQKVEKKPEERSEAYKSLFHKTYEENKDTDFLCRNAHFGLH